MAGRLVSRGRLLFLFRGASFFTRLLYVCLNWFADASLFSPLSNPNWSLVLSPGIYEEKKIYRVMEKINTKIIAEYIGSRCLLRPFPFPFPKCACMCDAPVHRGWPRVVGGLGCISIAAAAFFGRSNGASSE